MFGVFRFFCVAALVAASLCPAPPTAAAMPKAPAEAETKTVTGTVVETMNSSGYTYMLVAGGAGKTWVAIPESAVKKGSAVTYFDGMAMADFHSKSLNKTFDTILFSAGLVPGAAAAAPAPPAAAQDDSFTAALQAEQKRDGATPSAQVSGGSAVAVAPLQEISVPKAAGDNAYTVEEIFAKNKELAGKKIRLQGKVVKFSPNIMGRNWVHLQDGTGNPLHNSHDLVFTTDAILVVDSIVTMTGILAADKDFGAGYTYTAIVEQATVAK